MDDTDAGKDDYPDCSRIATLLESTILLLCSGIHIRQHFKSCITPSYTCVRAIAYIPGLCIGFSITTLSLPAHKPLL